MFTFLVTMVVLSAFVVAGLRVALYLYAQGAVGDGVRQVQSVDGELILVKPAHGGVQDYSVRYARTGILYLAGILLVLAIVVIVILSSLL